MRGNVRVFCRVRGGGEADRERSCVRVKAAASASGEDDDCAAILAARLESVVVEHKAGAGASEFSFDRVFGPAASQAQVFAEVSQLVQSALDGFDVCIFAYGQTSSGKTHSMLGGGGAGQEGVVPRAAKQLAAAVEQAAKRGWELGLEAAALEIYNDDVVDLLGAGAPQGKKLQVVQDEEWGTAVTHLAWVPLGSPEAIQTVLAQAAQKRAVSATALNASSSRSHLVFQLRLRGFHAASDARLRSQLSLVDLAGSERAARTGAQGAQLVEAQHINKSLSALGDVVAALKARAPHVPYRNCRLTHVLAGCLGSPSAKSLMLVHVAPEAANAQESVCSLRFAEKVHKVAVGAKK